MKIRDNMRIVMVALLLLCSIVAKGQLPTISSFNPKRGGVGTTISITGSNFGTDPGALTVRFGAVTSPVLTTTGSTLTVKVPAGASYDRISVTTNALTAWTRENFLPTFQGTGNIDYTTLSDNVDFAFFGAHNAWPEIKVQDVDGDEKPDIICSRGSKIYFYHNTATPGTIDANSLGTYELDLGTWNKVSGFSFCDIDNDGKQDLVCVYYYLTTETYDPPGSQPPVDYDVLNPFLRIYKNQAVAGNINAASFATPVDISLPVELTGCYDGYELPNSSISYKAYIESADLNLDGKEDLVLQTEEYNEYNDFCPADTKFLRTAVYRNNYSGSVTNTTFSYSYNMNSFQGSSNLSVQKGLAVSNINADNKPEVIPVTGIQFQFYNSRIYRNISSTGGSFSFASGIDIGDGSKVYSVDFDFDGKNDLYYSSKIRQNNVVGTVFDATGFGGSINVGNSDVANGFADINGDGTIDICEYGGSGAIRLIPNIHTSGALSGASFGPSTLFTTYGGNANVLSCNDIDLDGKPDVIFINSSGYLSIMRNQTQTTGAVLTIGDVSGGIGSTASVPVTATDLADVEGFQFTVSYDPTKLSYQSCTNWDAGVNSAEVLITNNASTGKLTFVYNDQAFSIANGTFFNINFSVIASSSGSTDVTWSDMPTPREFINSIPNILDITYDNGTVDIVNTLYNISGVISYDNGTSTPMTNVPVELLDNSQTVINTTTTDASGQYTFSGVANGSYTVRPSTTKAWGGVSSIDITLYKRHIGNVPGFILQGIRLGSGDVNVSTTLTSIDLTLIKRRIGAQISSFASGDWLFEDGSITVSGGNVSRNIKAICYGDANGSYTPPQ